MKLRGKWLWVVVPAVCSAALLAQSGRDGRVAPPREVVVAGRVVDLHTLMSGRTRTEDEEKSVREAIQAGVPAALQTDDGLILLGQGWKGPRTTLVRFALQEVEIKGQLYEKDRIYYLDIEEVKPVRSEHEQGDEAQVDPSEEPAPAPEPQADGACCLPDGGCRNTTFDSCSESNGNFYIGVTCEEINCR